MDLIGKFERNNTIYYNEISLHGKKLGNLEASK